MLDRRGWLIALGTRIGCLVGFQTGNWVPKTNLAGKKKKPKNKFGGSEELAPRQKLFRRELSLYLPTSVLRWIHYKFPPLFFKRNEFKNKMV